MIAAIGHDVRASIIATIVASLFYITLLVKDKPNFYDVNYFIRIPFLFIVGLFTSFLAETVSKEESHAKGLKLLLKLTYALNSSLSIEKMLEAVKPYLDSISKLDNWDIALCDNDTKKFNLLKDNLSISRSKIDPEILHTVTDKKTIYTGKIYSFFPLIYGGNTAGFLRIKAKKRITEEEITFFTAFASELALALEKVKLYDEIKYLANTDRLTKLYNYAYFLEMLDEKVSDSLRNNKEFIILMIDLDNFKLYNDSYGHVAGNAYLAKIANDLSKETGNNGILARYGGDEFVLYLERYDGNLKDYITKIKNNVEKNIWQYASIVKITLSIGYAVFPKDGNTAEDIIARADKSLYKAKSLGKNRICYI